MKSGTYSTAQTSGQGVAPVVEPFRVGVVDPQIIPTVDAGFVRQRNEQQGLPGGYSGPRYGCARPWGKRG
jgi:hypothetical protein